MKNKILGIAIVVLGIMMMSGVMADICDNEPWLPECVCILNPWLPECNPQDPCLIDPSLPECGGGTFCDMYPTDPSCLPEDPCIVNPELCSGYDPCLAHPSLPECSGSGGEQNEVCPIGGYLGDSWSSCFSLYGAEGSCISSYYFDNTNGNYVTCGWLGGWEMACTPWGSICDKSCVDEGGICPTSDRFCDVLTPTYRCELKCPVESKTIWSDSVGLRI